MGTRLYEKGVFINKSFDELNLSQPGIVQDVHAEYVHAGVDVIETNTFGANRLKLSPHGFGDKVKEINEAGARLAKAVAGGALVAGAVGPLGVKIEPWGPMSVDEARDMFKEQIAALVSGGVDIICLETFADVNELGQAIRAAKEAAPGLHATPRRVGRRRDRRQLLRGARRHAPGDRAHGEGDQEAALRAAERR